MSELLDGYATPEAAAVDSFLALLAERGCDPRPAQPSTLLAHSLQVAARAVAGGATDSLVAAALLHDLGHVMPDPARATRSAGDRRAGGHETVAAALLHPWFDQDVVEPVRLHVAAKRWLCTVEPAHAERLTEASAASLERQGGPMTPREQSLFTADPWHEDAVRLRRWIDEGADLGDVPTLESYRPLLHELTRVHQATRTALGAARERIDEAAA